MGVEVCVTKCERHAADTLFLECQPHCEIQIFDTSDDGLPPIAIGTKLRVECGEAIPDGADIVMAGHVFAQSPQYTFVSCGGILSKLPLRLNATTQTVFLGLTICDSKPHRGRGKRGRA